MAAIPELHTLFLGPSVTDADLAPLAGFKNLKRLDLTGARLTDAAAGVLAAMPQLEELALTRTGVGNAALEKLGRLPHLRYLEVSESRITPQVFGALQGYAALQVFSFSSARRLAKSDVQPLARFPLLHSLIINGTLLGPEEVGMLRARAEQSRWRPSLVTEAQAASPDDEKVDRALEMAGAPREKQPPSRFEGFSGLERIHQAESSLEDGGGSPAAPKIDVFEETEKNFLGEITVGVVSSRKKSSYN